MPDQSSNRRPTSIVLAGGAVGAAMSALSQTPQSWLDNLSAWVSFFGFNSPEWMSTAASPGLAKWGVTVLGLMIVAWAVWEWFRPSKPHQNQELELRSALARIAQGVKAYPYRFLDVHFVSDVEKLRSSESVFWLNRPDAQEVREFVLGSIDRSQQRFRITGRPGSAEIIVRIYELCLWLERAVQGKTERVPERTSVDPD